MKSAISGWTAAAAGLWMFISAGPAQAGAVISNGTVQLGVDDYGQLNVPGSMSAAGTTSYVGLRYVPTNFESTADGCLCEGWGVADTVTGIAGYANNARGIAGLESQGFESTADSATSVVLIRDSFGLPMIRVTHEYRPSTKTAYLYDVTVTIENQSVNSITPRYRRVMDWDTEPTAFTEYVTLQSGTASEVAYTSDDGFASANPLAADMPILFTGTATDSGPGDHGALFDFAFDALAPGEKKIFHIFYGAAGDEAGAVSALGAVGAEVYSFGQPSTDAGGAPADASLARPDLGKPNTFIFAFAGVGGTPVVEPDQLTVTPEAGSSLINRSYCVTAMLLDGKGAPRVGAGLTFAVTGSNPTAGTASTGSGGDAAICWNGVEHGDDVVTVSYGAISDTATVSWLDLGSSQIQADPAFQLNLTLDRSGLIKATPSATLIDATTKAPLAGQSISFTAGNELFCSASTNAMGVATCSSLLAKNSGALAVLLNHGYIARFDGNADYYGSSAKGALTARSLLQLKLFGVPLIGRR